MDHLSFLPPASSAAVAAELGAARHAGQPLTAALQQIAHAARRHVPSADEVSVTLRQNGRTRTLAATGPLAALLDERQYAAGAGPCLDAAGSGRTVLLHADDEQPAYPDFAAACRRSDVHHVVSAGLPAAAGVVGGLNCYALGPEPFTGAAVRLLETFAAFAAVAVTNAALYTSAAEEVQQLQTAMASRAAIEQAKGLIMARQRCTEEEAFQVLVRASQHHNRKLRDIAADLMATTQQ